MDYLGLAANFKLVNSWLWPFGCIFARLLGAIMLSILFPKDLSRLIKAGLALLLAGTIAPSLIQNQVTEDNLLINILLVISNYIYGAILGYMLSFPIWIIEACGNIIDMQRGEQIGALLNPSTGDPSSSIGGLITRAFVTYFVIKQGFLYFINTIYLSFDAIRLNQILLAISAKNLEQYINMFTQYLYWSIDLILPIIVALLLIDLIFGLINSFIPQLNVTIFSMPIKSSIALLILYICIGDLFHNVFVKFMAQAKAFTL
jgi:type III secretion protein SpaR/YscT/HrcT